MSGPLVGSARVEIEGDLGAFADRTRAKIGAAMSHVEGDVDQAFGRMETEAATSGTNAGQSYAAKAGAKIKAGLSKVKEAAGGILGDLGLAATLGAAFTGALSKGQNSEMLAARLGLSSDDAKRYGDIAGRIYGNAWGESLDEVSGAVATVKVALGDLVDDSQLEGLTTKALAFQGAFGYETTDSIKAVSQMLKTGLAKNADEAFDVLTKGEQAGVDKAGDLMDTFNEYGVQFQKLGIDGPKALGLLSQGLQGGARDSDLVADALKEFSIRAVDGSATSIAAFQSLGLNGAQMTAQIARGGAGATAGLQSVLDKLRGIQDPVKRAQVAAGLFGTQSEDLGAALYDLSPATAEAAKGMGGLAGASDEMTKHVGNTTPPLDALKRSAMTMLTNLASKALPVLQPFLTLLTRAGPVVVGLALAFSGMVVVTKVANAIKTFNEVILTAAARERIVAAATRVWTGVQAAFNLVMEANPILLVALAIAALVAGVIVAYNKVGWFRDMIDAAFAFIIRVAKGFASFFTDDIPAAFRAMIGWLRNVWNSVTGFLKTWGPRALIFLAPFIGIPLLIYRHFGQITGWLGRVWSSVIGGIRSFLSSALSWIGQLPGRILGFGGSMLRAGAGLMGKLWDGLKSVASSAGSIATDVAKTIVNTLVRGINAVLGLPWKLHFHINIPYAPDIDIGPYEIMPAIPEWHEKGGRLGQGWNVVGERGPEAIFNNGSTQQVFSNPSTQHMAGTGVLGGGGGGSVTRLHPDDIDALARIVWSRPAKFMVGARQLAQANNDGQMELARL